jgi:hypothetical protein
VAASCERSPPPVEPRITPKLSRWNDHGCVGACAPRSRAFKPARSGALGRLALTHPAATNAVAVRRTQSPCDERGPVRRTQSPCDDRGCGATNAPRVGVAVRTTSDGWGTRSSSVVVVGTTTVSGRARFERRGPLPSSLVVPTTTGGSRSQHLSPGPTTRRRGGRRCGGPWRRPGIRLLRPGRHRRARSRGRGPARR